MVLPASQYSVLDAQRVERLDADTFRCYVGALKLFSLQVEPVITVSVTVQERGPTVRLLNTPVRAGGAACWGRLVRACGLVGLRRGCSTSCVAHRCSTMPLLIFPLPAAAAARLQGGGGRQRAG